MTSKNRTKIDFNLDGLNEIVKEMGGKYVTRVGILGQDGARSGDDALGNAEIGLVHLFGSVSRNIPARDFLRFPLEFKSKEFLKGIKSGFSGHFFEKGEYKKVHELMGIKAENIVQDAFASGGFGHWPELAQSTAERKGSSAILIDSAQLRRSITSDVVNASEVK